MNKGETETNPCTSVPVLGSARGVLDLMTLLVRRVLPVFVCACAFGQDIGFGELMKHPDAYRGREVIVTAGYHWGFEWMELTCFEKQDAAWVEFDPELLGRRKLNFGKSAFDNVAKVRVRGVLRGGDSSGFGHSNGWRYQFTVREILYAKVLWKLHGNAKDIPEDVKLSACRQ